MDQEDCVRKIKVNSRNCRTSCSGLVVTSFFKFEQDVNVGRIFGRTNLNEYGKYTNWSPFPVTLKNSFQSDYRNPLRFVRIYFDTPTLERITKDQAAKFVDMLSAIGGTMGLLTGFSLISGVEILYHATALICTCVKMKKNQWTRSIIAIKYELYILWQYYVNKRYMNVTTTFLLTCFILP